MVGAHLQSVGRATAGRSRKWARKVGNFNRHRNRKSVGIWWLELRVSMVAYLSRYRIHLFRSSASIRSTTFNTAVIQFNAVHILT